MHAYIPTRASDADLQCRWPPPTLSPLKAQHDACGGLLAGIDVASFSWANAGVGCFSFGAAEDGRVKTVVMHRGNCILPLPYGITLSEQEASTWSIEDRGVKHLILSFEMVWGSSS